MFKFLKKIKILEINLKELESNHNYLKLIQENDIKMLRNNLESHKVTCHSYPFKYEMEGYLTQEEKNKLRGEGYTLAYQSDTGFQVWVKYPEQKREA